MCPCESIPFCLRHWTGAPGFKEIMCATWAIIYIFSQIEFSGHLGEAWQERMKNLGVCGRRTSHPYTINSPLFIALHHWCRTLKNMPPPPINNSWAWCMCKYVTNLLYRHLREMFKIDTADYMLSICGNSGLRELSSPGKSGSVFYLSHDDRFMIKTMRKAEVKVFQTIINSASVIIMSRLCSHDNAN